MIEMTPELTAFSKDLQPAVEDLYNRHLEVAKPWSLYEQIDWDAGQNFKDNPWSEEDYPLPEAVRDAVFVNLLTEDNAPYYTNLLLSNTPSDHPLQEWNRRWTMEEAQHAAAIRDWAHISRAVNPKDLEAARRIQMSKGVVPQPENLADMLAYVTFQEKATQVAHRNTASKLPLYDKMGKKLLGLIAGDEGLHHSFYRDLAKAGFEANPSLMMKVVARNVIHFAMPGTGIPGFARRGTHIAKAGIYNKVIFFDSVVKPTLEHWQLDTMEGFDETAKIARDDLYEHLDTQGKKAAKQADRQNREQQELDTRN